MIIAFILGAAVAGMGILLSVAVRNWMVAFVISGIVSGASIIIASIVRNSILIMGRGTKFKSAEDNMLEDQGRKWLDGIVLFSLPNIITTAVIYFKYYIH